MGNSFGSRLYSSHNVQRVSQPCKPWTLGNTSPLNISISGNVALWLIWLLKAPQSDPGRLVSRREDTRYLLHATAKAQTVTWYMLKLNVSLFGSHIPGIIMIQDEPRMEVQGSSSAWPAWTVLVPACEIIHLHTLLCRDGVVAFLPETKRRDFFLPFSRHPSVEQTVHMSAPPCWHSKRDVAAACKCVVPVGHRSSFGLADRQAAVWGGPLDGWRRSTGCGAAEHDLFQAPVSRAGSLASCFHLRYSFIGG